MHKSIAVVFLVSICLVKTASAEKFNVVATGTINQIIGVFDSSVEIGTPYTYAFTWDSGLPYGDFASNPPNYDRQTWTSLGAAYGATVSFGNYSSTGDDSSASSLQKQNNTNPSYGVPDLVVHFTTGGIYSGPFSYSGTVYTQIERGAVSDVFSNTIQAPETDWTFAPFDPNFSGFFWRLVGGPSGDALNSRVYGDLQSMTFTPVPEPSGLIIAGLGFIGLTAWGRQRRKSRC